MRIKISMNITFTHEINQPKNMTGGLKIKSKTECLDTRQNVLWCRNYSILHDIKIASDLIC